MRTTGCSPNPYWKKWSTGFPCICRISELNNQDRDKILATVAAMVLEFTEHFPEVWVYAQGSTLARTRLYQMGIAAHWDDIDESQKFLEKHGFPDLPNRK